MQPTVPEPTRSPVTFDQGARSEEAGGRRLSICLINPRFEPSYWGFEFALPLYPGARKASMIPGALPTLAALADGHDVTLVDENIEPIDWESLRRYDIVGVTGMIVQKVRMREILVQLKEMGIFVALGGPFVSVDETGSLHDLCDVLFVGEADTTWPEFLADFAAGKPYKEVYEQIDRTDLMQLPRPRYDLLHVDKYASGSLQFSRGCPFQCEFCDIIVTYGRLPRTKRIDQVITELEDMRAAGFFSVFIVDDNFIGNKKRARELLYALVEWQEKHGYPLRLSTEASMNLADDAEMLDLMYRANFRYVFIGIESPRSESLKETKKFQNTRGDSIDDKLRRIQSHGLDVYGGFIVGFDNDDMKIFDDQYDFIQRNGVQLAMVGMLSAIPKTPLFYRLEKAGRLTNDPNCNIVPKQMTADQLRENYWKLMQRLYSPSAFLDRYFRTYQMPEYLERRAEISRKANEGKFLPTLAYGMILFWNLMRELVRDGSFWKVGKVYARYFFTVNLRYRRDAVGLAQFMNRCVTHWHFYKYTREAVNGRLRLWNIS
jgi:radical SAM superfamily enzyme YgiQ (UPF0313 family)